MKIAIVTSHFTPTLADPTRVTNGLDAIVVKAIPILQEHGHEVHVICAGFAHEEWRQKVHVHNLVTATIEKLNDKKAKMNLTRSYYKNVKSCLHRIDPDLVWSHIPSPGTSADFALEFPTIHHVHEVNQNAMYAIGRLAGLAKVIENGGTVYNSYFAEKLQREIGRDFMIRTKDEKNLYLLEKPITSVYQFVNAPLDKKFLEYEITDHKDYAFMVGRYDEKFTGKNIHLLDKIGVPITACVSGHNTRIWKQLESTKTGFYLFNSDRFTTIEMMRYASCHIMAYLHETVGIFNYEMMCLGSLPITIGLSKDEPNAAWTFTKKVFGDSEYVPDCIPIDDPDLKERIENEIYMLANNNLATRQDIANKARSVLSHDAWYREFMSLIPNKSKKQSLDIF
ncbi:putative glycosyltransferase protein [Rhizobium phage RHph_Y68]|uniref:Putative glycosyltransferase protein n=1 Tax=Rhizobium phage RHph_Y68 TaxID=2509787 RepID=A0A7S5URR7_9CAUD|nr:glycosyltransferase [Rhizobium phage RHph_Y68]QIG68130.1 putative glycosyltransferase protein [Rhizobium phage RHph_Y68]